jgi:hypothetical protein
VPHARASLFFANTALDQSKIVLNLLPISVYRFSIKYFVFSRIQLHPVLSESFLKIIEFSPDSFKFAYLELYFQLVIKTPYCFNPIFLFVVT